MSPELIVAAGLGLAFGSFLNVCITRLPGDESLLRPPSRCPACGTPIRWYDNIPVLSYIALGGRCRACRARISPVYPIVEISTAVIFAGAYAIYGPGLLLVSRTSFACAMLVLFVIDLRHRILPNVITIPGILIGFAFSLLAEPGWRSSLAGILAGGGVLFAMAELYYRVRGEEGLGMGDVKMLAMVGAFLGWKLMLLTLVLGSFAGSLVGVLVVVLQRGNLKYALPFGTFLALAALVASVVGDRIVAWYLAFY